MRCLLEQDTSLAALHADLTSRPAVPAVSLATGFERYAAPCCLRACGCRASHAAAPMPRCFMSRYAERACEHEAGFDAYLTGACFAALGALGAKPAALRGVLHNTNSMFAISLTTPVPGVDRTTLASTSPCHRPLTSRVLDHTLTSDLSRARSYSDL